MKAKKLEELLASTPQPEEEVVGFKMYLIFSLILGLTSWLGFYVQPTIYHGAAAVWHATGMLTDAFTCGLPLLNRALALTSLANFSLFIFSWFKPWVLGQRTFYVASLLTLLVTCAYIMNLLMAYSITAAILPR